MSLKNRHNEAIRTLVEKFVQFFKESEVDGELLRSAEEYLNGNLPPNPEGFVIDILGATSPFFNTRRVLKAVDDMGLDRATLAASSLPAPLQRIVQEATLLAKCEKIRELAVEPFVVSIDLLELTENESTRLRAKLEASESHGRIPSGKIV